MHKKIISRFAIVQWIELVIALTVLGGLTAFNIYSGYTRTEANEHDRLITQANVISKNIAFQFQGANQALLTVLRDIPEWKHSRETAIQRLTSLADAMPGIRSLSVFDAQGTLLYTNFPQYIGKNFSYRDYYITAKQFPDPTLLYVSPPFKGLRGHFVLNLTRIIPGKHGEFAGIVTATLDPEYFKPLLASVLYTPDSRSSLVHSDGALFISAPDIEQLQGMNLAVPGSFFTRHMQSGKTDTVFSGEVYSTKEQRMMAQTTLPAENLKLHGTLLVAVSRDLAQIFKHWRETAIIQGLCFFIFSAFSLSTLYIYQRREHKYAQIAADTSHALFQSEKLFRSTYDSAAIGMTLLDHNGRFRQANRALCNSVGYDETTLCQKTIQQLTHPDDLQADQPLMRELLSGQREHFQVEKRFFHRDGHTLWMLLTYSTLKDEQGALLNFVVQIQDISETILLQEKLQSQANHDFLTGLPNRRYFIERANAELSRLKRYGGSLGLLLVDIDHFKKINDVHGHVAGDLVLQRFSQHCKLQLRDIDLISRYGGEEFAILLPETNLPQAVESAERLRASAASTPIGLTPQQDIHLTISIGVAVADATDTSLEKLLIKADTALYKAKQNGRNKVITMTPGAD